MFFRKFKLWFLAFGALAIIVCCTIFVQKQMDSVIKEDKLVDEASIEGLPPMVAFTTVALGGFRGLLADMLWLRTSSLQQQGKYFEMVQLASWITKLQPKFTGATAYLAWNMAYNISVTFTSPVDRWRWVQRGIELIRDEALNYNANDPLLYRELGWIYQHKIGNMLDDAQRYYKFMIAAEMMKVFGGVPAPDWEALAAAPATDYEFSRKYAADSPLWAAVRKAGFENLDSLSRTFRELGFLPDDLIKLLTPEDKTALDTYLRAKWLREYYKIRPDVVLRINKKYGDLDWRVSDSYAIYWATLGIEYSPKRQSVDCNRMITQSLKESFIAGRILFPGKPSINYMLIPNLNLADSVRQAYLDAWEQDQTPTFKSALDNFMKDAIVTLYSYGQYGKAREYFNIQRKKLKGNRDYRDFDTFILREWTEDIKDGNYKQAHELISGLIFQSCLLLGYDDPSGADAHLRLAQLAYAKYSREFKDSKDRVGLPPFDTMKSEIAKSFMKNFPTLSDRVRAYITVNKAEAEAEKENASPAKK